MMYKVVIVGDGAVGKTTILKRYVDKKFDRDIKMTVGSDFFVKKIELEKENADVTLQIWDLAGQQQFSVVRPNFYMGAKGVVYTFDLTRKVTLLNLTKWQKEVENVIGKTPSILVGNKLDLVENKDDEFMQEDALQFKKDLGALEYIETSAKEDIGVSKVFKQLTRKIFNSYSKKV
ncbi:MAG: Small GTP-binding domain protein [Promethearchaeota archaeon]|nr:MAG: Small GTP-binding domain protein [Candidatus Lokiarchaeota archaeon]